MAEEDSSEQPIIIKKINKGHGHHGGAWKVAYADFVTAMMAFFLLLWLLNVTTEEQKNAISNYFDPTHPKVSQSESGAGGILGGLSMSPTGSMATMAQPINAPRPSPAATKGQSQSKNAKEEAAKEKKRKKEEREFKKAERDLKRAIANSPELKGLMKNLMIDMTPEGLRIQIIDREGEPMFPSGSAQMYQKTRDLLTAITKVIDPLDNEISVRGHTDSVPYGSGADYTNWELSSDRANASRRVMLDANLPKERLNNVMGKADTELLITEDSTDPRNRRITLILLREELTNPENYENLTGNDEDDGESYGSPAAPEVPVGTFRKTPGKIEFP
ncbi:MAG: motility protein MotB [Micavibrio sp.]|nr:motility protein MotB [Micavibrio sp.]|tara:strand:+ start:7796 stop:8791 length:996 start_codon:yes stop_codon:yes gene_type:complete